MDDLLAGCLVVIALIALVVVGPLITIWAVNLLFGLTIPMNIGTWFAALWLGGIGTALRSRSKD